MTRLPLIFLLIFAILPLPVLAADIATHEQKAALGKRIEETLERVKAMQEIEALYKSEARRNAKNTEVEAAPIDNGSIFINQAYELEPKRAGAAEEEILEKLEKDDRTPYQRSSEAFLRQETLDSNAENAARVTYQREADAAREAQARRLAEQQQQQTQQAIQSLVNQQGAGVSVSPTPQTGG